MIRNSDLDPMLDSDVAEKNVPGVPQPMEQFASAHHVREEGDHTEMAHLVQRVFMSGEVISRQVLFCGVDEKGRSTDICARAGRSLAAWSGKSVCLIDANRHAGSLTSLFGKRAANTVTSRPPLAAKAQIEGNLWLAVAEASFGRTGGSDGVIALKEQLIRLRGEFEYVLIDAPPILTSEDAAMLGTMTDGIILVIEAGVTRRIAARKAKQIIEEAGVAILGAVLHNRSFPIPEPIYRRI